MGDASAAPAPEATSSTEAPFLEPAPLKALIYGGILLLSTLFLCLGILYVATSYGNERKEEPTYIIRKKKKKNGNGGGGKTVCVI